MCLIRRAGALALVLGLLAGCQQYHVQLLPRSPQTTGLSNTPIPTDPAMQTRQWDVTQAFYVNDAVFAHPNYSPLQVEYLPYEGNAVIEPVLFLGDVIYIPFGLFVEAPWIFQANKSLALPSSYTLMPVLPQGAQGVPTY